MAKKVQRICVAYDGLERFFPEEKMIKTGNPVRQDLLDIDSKIAKAKKHFNLVEGKKTLLVIGGSLGARRINQLIRDELDYFQYIEYAGYLAVRKTVLPDL